MELTVGQRYYKVHKTKGHEYGPREFLGVTEFGYYTFVGPLLGQVISDSPELWDFYAVDDVRPTATIPPDSWREGPDGAYAENRVSTSCNENA